MSDSGINYVNVVYIAIAVPLLMLAVVRWRIMRRRQLEQVQTVTTTGDSGFAAQDFVLGNPYSTTHQTTYPTQPTSAQQTDPVYTIDPPPSYQDATRNSTSSKKAQKTPVEEPPSMIQTRRWF